MAVRLRFDEEHALLRDAARRWLAERVTPAELRRLARDSRGDDPTWWAELGELGWTGLVVPEKCGGAGFGAVHLAVIAEETGRKLLPSPLLLTLLAAKLIELAGSDAQRERFLPRIAGGEAIASVAHVEPVGAWDARATRCPLSGTRVRGEKAHVWAAARATLFVVPARDSASGALRVAVVEAGAPGVHVEAESVLDASRPQGRVRFDDAECEPLAGDSEPAWDAWCAWAQTALAAEMAGGADA
ncbi:MAG TPA: acyl-CoA dehydrogenase family protein, partial [Myxococcota bacterium]|nr:acyl-CoA dehydrogenase family protein [Myxococcota bacterium]